MHPLIGMDRYVTICFIYSIYVDAVINHMTGGGSGIGSGGSWWDADSLDYPGVPYSSFDFHGSDVCFTGSGNIEDYNDANQVKLNFL